jgi:hypothetical protein
VPEFVPAFRLRENGSCVCVARGVLADDWKKGCVWDLLGVGNGDFAACCCCCCCCGWEMGLEDNPKDQPAPMLRDALPFPFDR